MTRRLTYEYVKEYVESLGYTLISEEYKNMHSNLKMICNKGHEIEKSFVSLKSGRGCPKCSGKILTYNEVKSYIESQGYELLSDKYINATSKLKLKCSHNHVFEKSWNNFKNHNQRCPICKKKNGIDSGFTYEEVKEYIESFGYKLISKEYKDCKHYISIECPKHGIWEVTFDNFKNRKSRCPKCKNSKGEDEVARILNKLHIEFKNKYKFPNCRYKRTLEFDFYLSNMNVVIEYDGEYHYMVTNRNNNEDFKNQKHRDSIKDEYCKNNNIKLIRIPYWEYDNIEKILIKELNL